MFWEEREEPLDDRDREIVALTYLAAAVPLFGLLVAGIVYLLNQERSRRAAFHARQAIAGQVLALAIFCVLVLFGLFALLAGILQPVVKDVMLLASRVTFYMLVAAHVVWHLAVAWRSLEGRDVIYPVIGSRLREPGE